MALQEQKWDEAQLHLQAAVAINPNHADAHSALATAYFHLGDLSRANAEFSAVIRLEPKSAEAHYNLGLLLRLQKLDAQAAREFRETLALDPRFHAAQEALSTMEQGKN